MNIYFTSDLHFGHANIIRYCNRPFSSAEEMNEKLLTNWNNAVQHSDHIYILGDVFFMKEKQIREFMPRLQGVKHLVLGNHDKMLRKNNALLRLFDEVLPDLTEIKINDNKLVLCHYPLLSWNSSSHGSFMLHGHIHSSQPTDGKFRRYDVGVDANDYKPVTAHHVIKTLSAIPQLKF